MISSKDLKSKNPLPEILGLISYGDSVVDLELCDNIRNHLNLRVDDSAVLMLLMQFRDAGLVELRELTFPSTHGKVVIIKRVING